MSPLTLTNVVMSTIAPFEKREHVARIYPTAKFDLLSLNLYIPIVFFYKPQGAHLGSFKLMDLLKESLSKVLIPYFPFAGRWIRTSDTIVKVLQCCDEGVPFIEASTDAELNSVLDLEDFESSIEFLGGFQLMGLQTCSSFQDIDPRPPLFVQATQFKCGGFALHVNFCHMTADAGGMLTFMKAWSEIALLGQTSIIPTHDRSIVSSPVVYVEEDCNIGIKDIANVNSEKTIDSIGEKLTASSELVVMYKTLHVKRDVVENLKREAADKHMEVTIVDLITAHCWRSISNLPESSDGKTCTSANIVIDGRQRFHDPPLPEHFSGNAVMLTELPQLSVAELSANSVLVTANAVHQTVRAINSSTWEDSIARFDKLESRQIIVSSWFRYPLYEVIFSSNFGRPVFANQNCSKTLELGILTATVSILPPPPVLSKDVIATIIVGVDNTLGHVLLSDQEFLSFIHRF